MQNDVLKNEIAPWQEKGRWYHGFLGSSLSSLDPKRTDKFLLDHFGIGLNGGFSYLRERTSAHKYNILDVKFQYTTFKPQNSVQFSLPLYLYTDGRIGFFIGGVAGGTGDIEFWAYIVENK